MNCFGDGRKTTGSSLILPETAAQCSALAGNYASFALDWNQLENAGRLVLEVDNGSFTAPPTKSDFVTLSFYAFQPGYEPNNYGLRFLASDEKKYYLQSEPPVY